MSLGLKKSTLTRTIEASRNLSSGAVKFPLVRCGNRRQSLPTEDLPENACNFTAEQFTCGHCR